MQEPEKRWNAGCVGALRSLLAYGISFVVALPPLLATVIAVVGACVVALPGWLLYQQMVAVLRSGRAERRARQARST